MKTKHLITLSLIGLLVFLAACGVDAPAAETAVTPGPMTIRLPMGYIPDPQYAPLYVAADKGYFAQEGLTVDFDYSFETDGIALVGANETPFSLAGGDQVILARAQGLPIVSVLEWFQKYPIAVVSKTATGIAGPKDLAGHKVGLPGFFGTSYVGYVGLLSANGMSQDDVDAVDIGFTQVESLVADQTDAVVVFINNEPIQLRNLGEDIQVIAVADYIDLLSNGLVTNEETIANNPELVQGFVRAMLHGLADTIANPDEAYEISKNYVEGLDNSRKEVLTASIDLWQAETLGLTDPASWDRTQEILQEMGLLDSPLDNLDKAYSNVFVENGQPE